MAQKTALQKAKDLLQSIGNTAIGAVKFAAQNTVNPGNLITQGNYLKNAPAQQLVNQGLPLPVVQVGKLIGGMGSNFGQIEQNAGNKLLSSTTKIGQAFTNPNMSWSQRGSNLLQGTVGVPFAMGNAIAPLTTAGKLLNFTTSLPSPVGFNNDLLGRGANFVQRFAGSALGTMSGTPQIGEQLASKNIKIGDIDTGIDVAKTLGSLYGFGQQPTNKILFPLTNKLFQTSMMNPYTSKALNTLFKIPLKGGIEGLTFALGQMPDNLTPKQLTKYVQDNIGQGVAFEAVMNALPLFKAIKADINNYKASFGDRVVGVGQGKDWHQVPAWQVAWKQDLKDYFSPKNRRGSVRLDLGLTGETQPKGVGVTNPEVSKTPLSAQTGLSQPEQIPTSNVSQTAISENKSLQMPQSTGKGSTSTAIIQPKYTSNINLDKLNISPRAKANLTKAVEDINAELITNKGNPLTTDEVLNLAQVSTAFNRVVPRENTRQFAAKLTTLRQQVAAGAEGKGLSSDFIENIKTLNSIAADTGRRLKAFDIGADPNASSIKQSIVAELVKLGHSTDEILNAAKDFDLNNPKQATEFYRKFVKPTLGEQLTEYRYINLLSSPKTHIVNAFSNLIQAGVMGPGTKLYSGAVDIVGSTLTGKERQHYVSEVPAYYKGLFNSLGDAITEAGKVFRGESFSGRPDVNRLPTNNPVTKNLQFIPRALDASDVFFRTMIKGAEKESLLNKLSRQGKTLSAATIDKMAGDKATYLVFRQALDPSNKTGQGHLLSNIDKMTEAVYQLRKVPGVNWFIPFVQTPMNILKQGIEYSPAGIATLPGAANKTEQLAKALMGSTVMAGAAWVIQAGDSTWSAPTGEKDKEAFYASGRQPYSIKIGDQWVSYSRLGPLAYPIAMAAALKYYYQQDPKSSSRSKLESTGKMLAGMTKFFSDQSYMQGLGDLVKTVQGDVSAAKQFITNAPSQLIPLESLLGWVTRAIDPIYRQPSNVKEQMMTGIPGLSTQVPAYTNPGGEPSVRKNNLFNTFSPVTATPNDKSYGNLLNMRNMNSRFDLLNKQFKDLIKSGQTKEAMALLNSNKEIFKNGAMANNLTNKVGDIQGTRDRILKDPRLTPERKQRILKIISSQIQKMSNSYAGSIGGAP